MMGIPDTHVEKLDVASISRGIIESSDVPRTRSALIGKNPQYNVVAECAKLERELTMEKSKKSPEAILMLMETVRDLEKELNKAQRKIDALTIDGDEIIQCMTIEIPERNCSCHISPPCNDCVEYGHARELLDSWEKSKKM